MRPEFVCGLLLGLQSGVTASRCGCGSFGGFGCNNWPCGYNWGPLWGTNCFDRCGGRGCGCGCGPFYR